mgnify:CR=1 FL=1
MPSGYALRLMLTDPLAMMGWVFAILVIIFSAIGIPLILVGGSALAGLLFGGLELLFLAAGVGFGLWRFQMAAQTVNALRVGRWREGESSGWR